jgi:hypothetical protein
MGLEIAGFPKGSFCALFFMNHKVFTAKDSEFFAKVAKNFVQISQIYGDAYSSALLRENLCAPLREKYSAQQSREKSLPQISQIYADTFFNFSYVFYVVRFSLRSLLCALCVSARKIPRFF